MAQLHQKLIKMVNIVGYILAFPYQRGYHLDTIQEVLQKKITQYYTMVYFFSLEKHQQFKLKVMVYECINIHQYMLVYDSIIIYIRSTVLYFNQVVYLFIYTIGGECDDDQNL